MATSTAPAPLKEEQEISQDSAPLPDPAKMAKVESTEETVVVEEEKPPKLDLNLTVEENLLLKVDWYKAKYEAALANNAALRAELAETNRLVRMQYDELRGVNDNYRSQKRSRDEEVSSYGGQVQKNKFAAMSARSWAPPPSEQQRQYSSGRQRQYSPGRQRQYSPGRSRQYSPGRPRQYSPGRPRHYSPGRPRQYSPGRPRHYSPGRPRHYSPGRPKHHSPGRPKKYCEICRMTNHSTEECRVRTGACFGCGELGHRRFECTNIKNPKKKSKKSPATENVPRIDEGPSENVGTENVPMKDDGPSENVPKKDEGSYSQTGEEKL